MMHGITHIDDGNYIIADQAGTGAYNGVLGVPGMVPGTIDGFRLNSESL